MDLAASGACHSRKLSKTGEQLDDRLRAELLDESLDILTAAWSGRPVRHTVRGVLRDGPLPG